MKIKSIASICKNNKSVILYEGKSCQWISDGAAIYPLFGLPKMTKENIFTMFDVPEEKQSGFYFDSKEELPSFCFSDADGGERLLDRATLSVCAKGHVVEPLKTSLGIAFINEKYLAPFGDCVNGFELYERVTKSGQVYIAVKEGFILLGIIMPYDLVNEEFVNDLNSLFQLSSVALANKQQAEREKERQRSLFAADNDDEEDEEQ
ncbi:MAG: hypothetical protein A2Y17_12225 [Clostridiales bacterium GWF2_38_85]|nr:MAG: hypothetical protein A2Y17_12225 [Clostridiales bacterium GWF2_38_85]